MHTTFTQRSKLKQFEWMMATYSPSSNSNPPFVNDDLHNVNVDAMVHILKECSIDKNYISLVVSARVRLHVLHSSMSIPSPRPSAAQTETDPR